MKFIRLFNAFKWLRDIGTANTEHKTILTRELPPLTVSEPSELPPVTANATARTPVKSKRTVRWSREFLQNQQAMDFNLTEALRLRALGWGNRKIARRMNNVSRETVRVRLREYDELHTKPTSPQQPPNNSATVTEKPCDNRATLHDAQPEPVTLTVPPPVTNLADLVAMRKARYSENQPTDLTHVFLVRPEHVKYGLGSEQPVIGFDRWHSEYQRLELFQKPVKFWVLVNAEDGAAVNRPWLDTIASDIWLRERCFVLRVTDVLAVFQSRYGAQHQYPAQAFGKALADDTFERWHKFEPMPLHSHRELLETLGQGVTPTKELVADAQAYGVQWTAPQAMPPQARYDDDGRLQREECAGGLCTG